MTEETNFIEHVTNALVKGAHRLIPNLRDGDFVYIMKDTEGGYQERKYKIREVKTIIDDRVDSILQNVVVIDLGVAAEYRSGK